MTSPSLSLPLSLFPSSAPHGDFYVFVQPTVTQTSKHTLSLTHVYLWGLIVTTLFCRASPRPGSSGCSQLMVALEMALSSKPQVFRCPPETPPKVPWVMQQAVLCRLCSYSSFSWYWSPCSTFPAVPGWTEKVKEASNGRRTRSSCLSALVLVLYRKQSRQTPFWGGGQPGEEDLNT